MAKGSRYGSQYTVSWSLDTATTVHAARSMQRSDSSMRFTSLITSLISTLMHKLRHYVLV
jgi:hypothetical protein